MTPAECGVSEYDREASVMGWLVAHEGLLRHGRWGIEEALQVARVIFSQIPKYLLPLSALTS